MGHFFTNPQGRPDDMGNRVIRRRITYNQNGFAAGIPIGAFERGSVIVRATAVVNTAFNAGTTNVVTLGSAATPAGVMASADIAPGATGLKTAPNTGALMGQELAADTVFNAYFTQTGTAATAGDVTLIIEAVPPYPWSDLNGGQAQ